MIDSLPTNWTEAALGELGEWGSGGTPPKKNESYYKNGTIPWLVIGDLNDGEVSKAKIHITEDGLHNSSAKLIEAGTLLVAMYGSIGKLGITSIKCATNQAIAFCRPDSNIVELKFLFHALANANRELIAQGQGGAQQNISQTILKAQQISLPPINEQRRIADKLDTTLAAVEACKQKLNSAAETIQRFRQSVLAAAVSGELTREWREERKIRTDQANNEIAELIEARISSSGRRKAKLPVEPDTSNWRTDLPETWALASVSMFAECLDSQRIPVKKEERLTATGIYPYYGANGIVDKVDEYIFDDELVLVTEDETFYGRTKPIAYRSSGKCWVNNHAHVLRPQDKISANYLCYALMHYPVIPWLTGTTGRAKLTQAVLNALPIGVPPREEMEYIVNNVQILFQQADELESRLKAGLESLAQLQPSILAKAFRGELVPQDPNDEPAAVLLERIKAQREAEAAAKKPAKRGRKKKADAAQLVIPEGIADNHLAKVLEECGALSERALLAASELEPNAFELQLAKETGKALIMRNTEDMYELTNTQTSKEEKPS